MKYNLKPLLSERKRIKISILILLSFYVFLPVNGQELFVDNISGDTCLFVGCIEDENKLKVYEQGKFTSKDHTNLTQVGLLIGNEFTDKLFEEGLCFELDGYEPFWNASIFKNTLSLWLSEDDSSKQYNINTYTSERSSSSVFFMMFISECGTIFGTINNIGLTYDNQCRICEYNISEEGQSLYEVYISVKGSIYKGCVTIELNQVDCP